MEENIALDSSKQKKFVKSIKGIKKLITQQDKTVEPKKPDNNKVKDGKIKKKKTDRGLVYLSHIPHGFYEHQMTEYFKQFGGVTNARVIRSKRTGRSKGHAFVEFRRPEVAEIVAETMNNYLMGKRLIKAVSIPPNKQRRHAKRKNWNTIHNPAAVNRLKLKQAFNKNKDEQGDLKKARKIMSNIERTKKKLSELGINYDFFTPVDIPQALIKIKEEDDTVIDKEDKVKSDKKKAKKLEKSGKDSVKDEKLDVKPKKEIVKDKTVVQKEIKDKKSKKGDVQHTVVNKKEQKLKNKNLKESGVVPMENFIKLQQESDNDTDSSADIEPDEYDKMIENDYDSSDNMSGSSDDSDDHNEVEEDSEEESVVEIPPKKVKPALKQVGPVHPKKTLLKQQEAKKSSTEINKRKSPKSALVPQKKPKFEKQNKQKPMKKQFKKKK